MLGLEEKIVVKRQPMFNAGECKVLVGGVEMVGGTGQISECPRKWYKILEQNDDTFTVEVNTKHRIVTFTLYNKELDKFLELEDTLESPFNITINNKGE